MLPKLKRKQRPSKSKPQDKIQKHKPTKPHLLPKTSKIKAYKMVVRNHPRKRKRRSGNKYRPLINLDKQHSKINLPSQF